MSSVSSDTRLHVYNLGFHALPGHKNLIHQEKTKLAESVQSHVQSGF